jgi:hypothetical protein
MAPQPHWTIPVNFRVQDKSVLDAALNIAKIEGKDITSVFRAALLEFIERNALQTGGRRMDEFLDISEMSKPVYNRILTPQELVSWSESSLLDAAKLIRSRKDELDAELRRRGFFIKW